jgi:hypothetical protein
MTFFFSFDIKKKAKFQEVQTERKEETGAVH